MFNRGDVFYGQLIINNSGASGNPITFGAYGTGSSPVLTGFTSVNSWKYLGNNIWESTSSISSLSSCNMVSINGVNTPMGRYPNSGYLTFQSFVGNTSITTNNLSGSINWTGAEAVIRKNRWNIDRNLITSQYGSTLNFAGQSFDARNNFGFLIQNDIRTLDQQNEWYFNPSTAKISIFNSSNPGSGNVQVASLNILVYTNNSSYINFNNLSFQGDNQAGIKTNNGQYISIQNCDFNYSGLCAIDASSETPFILISNCTIKNSNNYAINVGSSPNSIITNNNIKNTGIIPGAGAVSYGSYIGIHSYGDYGNISYNSIDSSGYNAIEFDGDGTEINNNYITNYCSVLDDGGGIYTFPSQGPRVNIKRTIKDNIVLNGIGAGGGTDNPTSSQAIGIYLDGSASNIDIIGNTVSNASFLGLFLHGSHEINVDSNTLYNNLGDNQLYVKKYDATPINNIVLNNNIFFAKTITPTNQYCVNYEPMATSMPASFIADNNYYARPIDDNLTIWVNLNGNAGFKTLAQWQIFSGQDVHSHKSPKSITDINDLMFVYNPTNSTKTLPLNAKYIDVKNISYNGTITLSPYTSAVLIKNGLATNQPPVANAGPDGSITLPVNTYQLEGSGTSSTGTIIGYNWTQVSGPTESAITASNSASTSITGMIPGIYVFQLMVTDNNGSTGVSTVQINVNNGSNNISQPIANAGADGSITLPVNTYQLEGSGTSSTGTIIAYNWTQVSGPTESAITSPNSASTSIRGMVPGLYVFQLQVTDNNGAIGVSTVQVNVNNGSSLLSDPTANAGIDGNITLPVNTYQLEGSGTSSSGFIASYSWSQISGPSPAIISFPNSASSSVMEMVPGTYVFQLQVTDNNGATGISTVRVNVNIPPIANAGSDGNITLPINTYQLQGSGTSETGTIIGYNWSQISGPASGTITSPYSASTSVKGMIPGSYVFQLQVTDNNGINGYSTIQVNVSNSISTRSMNGNNQATLNPNTNLSITNNQLAPTTSASLKVGVTAYPNPFLNSITVTISGDAGQYRLMLTDASGRITLTKDGTKTIGTVNEVINTSTFSKGIYMLNVIQNNKNFVIKLVK
ncbi:MAG: T9SS type A sorting domain-containing protein [Bacteroidota bacterium]|nr:T9SS type A sorting domain-containing protein [Bacteroidota bacterium]